MSGESSTPRVSSPSSGRNSANSFQLRIFCKFGNHHTKEMFNAGNEPTDVIQITTWKDATLKEITHKVKYMVHRTALRRNAMFSFAIVSHIDHEVRQVGCQSCYENPHEAPVDTSPTLEALGYKDGDYLDVAIL